jgi:hypothetical protein
MNRFWKMRRLQIGNYLKKSKSFTRELYTRNDERRNDAEEGKIESVPPDLHAIYGTILAILYLECKHRYNDFNVLEEKLRTE